VEFTFSNVKQLNRKATGRKPVNLSQLVNRILRQHFEGVARVTRFAKRYVAEQRAG